MEEEERLRALASPGGGPRLEIGRRAYLHSCMGLAASARWPLNCFDAAVPCSPPASPDSQSPHAASAAQNAIAFREAVGPRPSASGGAHAGRASPASSPSVPPEPAAAASARASACTTLAQRIGAACTSSPPPLTVHVQQADAPGAPVRRPARAAQRVPLRRPPAANDTTPERVANAMGCSQSARAARPASRCTLPSQPAYTSANPRSSASAQSRRRNGLRAALPAARQRRER